MEKVYWKRGGNIRYRLGGSMYHGALLARGLYESMTTGELKTMPPDGIIEPPVLEFLASLSYLILGAEHLWIPRLLSALFWMVGGAFLYLIARKISSPNAAVFSVAFYLFVPYSVFASRAFMPDPLMVMLLMISIFAILRYHEQPSMRRLIVAAVASALIILVKPGICVFQVFGAFFSLAVYRQGVRKALGSPRLLAFAVLSILPTGVYIVYGKFVSGFLDTSHPLVSQRIVPQLLLQASFWEGWFSIVSVVVSPVALLVGLVGAFLFLRRLPRALLLGLWGGYLLFGLTFTYHIHTHDYYSLQLVPVVA
jgi:4-amino-4-deoxy-L-arabinose transferase-like glycosyltransferase